MKNEKVITRQRFEHRKNTTIKSAGKTRQRFEHRKNTTFESAGPKIQKDSFDLIENEKVTIERILSYSSAAFIQNLEVTYFSLRFIQIQDKFKDKNKNSTKPERCTTSLDQGVFNHFPTP